MAKLLSHYIFQNFLLLYSQSYSGEANKLILIENIQKSVELAGKLTPFNPFTIRLINFEVENEARKKIWELLGSHPKILGSSSRFLKDLEPDTRQLRNEKYFQRALALKSFFTLVYASTLAEFLATSKIIKSTVNPRLDFLLIIIDSYKLSPAYKIDNEFITKWFPVLSHHLYKMVLDFGSPSKVWTDSLNYSKNYTLTQLDRVPSGPLGNPRMGYNLRQRFFRTSISDSPPYSFEVKKVNSSQPSTFKGIFIDLMDSAAAKFNFTYSVTNDGMGYGKLLENGTWIGKYSRVFYADSGYDIALFMASHYLMQRGDRSSPVATVNMGFIMGVPKKQQVPWYGFLEPFGVFVWTVSCGTFIAIGLLHAILIFFLYKQPSLDSLWATGFFLTLSIALEQNGYKVPEKLRSYVIIWVSACLVLGTAYRSQLRSHLMYPNEDKFPSTYEELAQLEKFKVTLVVFGKIEHAFFFENEVTLMKKLRRRIKVENNWFTCINKAFYEEDHICITWSMASAIVAQTMTLNTTVDPFLHSKDYVLLLYTGLAFQQNSLFSTAFELICSSAYEMGLMTKWEEQTMFELKSTGRKRLLKEENLITSPLIHRLREIAKGFDDKVPLKMESLKAVFGILLLGSLLGALMLPFEYYFAGWSSKKNDHVHMSYQTTRDLIGIKNIINEGKLLRLEMGTRNNKQCGTLWW